MMETSSRTPLHLHLKADATLTQQSRGDCPHTHIHIQYKWPVSKQIQLISLPLLLLLLDLVVHQCYGGELLLSAPPSAAPSTLPSSLYPVLPAGGARGGPVLGAHPATQQTARPVAAQLPGRSGVSLHMVLNLTV